MDDSPAPLDRPRHRCRRILCAAGILLAVLLAALWFGPGPNVPIGPVQLVRGEDGRMTPVNPADDSTGFFPQIQAGAIEANNSFNSTAVSSRSDHAGFACSRLAIFNRSNHLLMARVGQLLPEKLQALGCIRQIDYYPAGFDAKQGERAPDVVVTLDLNELTEGGLPGWRTLKAQFHVTAGNGAPGCRNSYTDHFTPPLVQFEWSGALDHTSTMTGVSSSAAKYKLVAENVASRIADSLTKAFQERLEAEGPSPEFPTPFYPPYRPAPDLPLAEFGKTEIVSSWHGVLNHNETLWRLDLAGPADDFFGEMPQRLEAAGWKKSAADKQHLRFTNNAAILVAYVPSERNGQQASAKRTPFVYVQYVDRMTQDEVRAAIDQALAANASPDVLIRFERLWSEEQSRRMLERLRGRPARTPGASLALANLYHRLKQDDDARNELERTCALLRTIAQDADLRNKAKSLAKELGDEKLADRPIEPGFLHKLGFIDLLAAASIPPQEIGIEEPVHFYAVRPDRSLQTVSVRALKVATAGDQTCQLAFVDSSEHGRSWGTSGTTHGCDLGDQRRATFSLETLEEGKRFRLVTQLSGPANEPGK